MCNSVDKSIHTPRTCRNSRLQFYLNMKYGLLFQGSTVELEVATSQSMAESSVLVLILLNLLFLLFLLLFGAFLTLDYLVNR